MHTDRRSHLLGFFSTRLVFRVILDSLMAIGGTLGGVSRRSSLGDTLIDVQYHLPRIIRQLDPCVSLCLAHLVPSLGVHSDTYRSMRRGGIHRMGLEGSIIVHECFDWSVHIMLHDFISTTRGVIQHLMGRDLVRIFELDVMDVGRHSIT